MLQKFSYNPQYGDFIYLGIFLIGGGTIALMQQPIFIPLVWLVVIALFYFFIKKKPLIYFFEDHIELKSNFGKTTVMVNYVDVKLIEYVFLTGGRHLIRITFSEHLKIGTLQYTFYGSPGKIEVLFLESKNLPIKVSPLSAKHRFYKNVR